MTALASITPALAPGAKIPQILAHIEDCHPEDAARLTEYLNRRDLYAATDVADVLTHYCRHNNLGSGVSEASVRRYRKTIRETA